MSTKYLGENFDIHGGGMDLKFPHHECEIAQAEASNNVSPVNYWMHANMLTLNGKKMSKSTGNFILPNEMFTGENDILSKPFSPTSIKDRKSTRLNSSHVRISYAVFCLKKKKKNNKPH